MFYDKILNHCLTTIVSFFLNNLITLGNLHVLLNQWNLNVHRDYQTKLAQRGRVGENSIPYFCIQQIYQFPSVFSLQEGVCVREPEKKNIRKPFPFQPVLATAATPGQFTFCQCLHPLRSWGLSDYGNQYPLMGELE